MRKTKNFRIEYSRKRALFCTNVLVLTLGLILSMPFVPQKTNASATTQHLFAEAQTAPSLNVETTAWSVSGGGNDYVIPGGGMNSKTMQVITRGSNYSGYTLYGNINSITTNLIHEQNSEYVIPQIQSTIEAASFPTGYWGISTNLGGSFFPLATSNASPSPLNYVSVCNQGDTCEKYLDVNFSTKVSTSQPEGRYVSSVTFSILPNVASYAINFDKNTTADVQNFPTTQNGIVSPEVITLAGNNPSRSGYIFLGWSEDSAATAATFTSGASVYLNQSIDNSNITLYAIWQEIVFNYTLNYNANGGTGAPLPQTMTTPSESYTFTIPAATPTNSGKQFAGWATSQDATTAEYQPGSTITIQSSNPTKTLYAVWNTKTTLENITYMQEVTQQICTDTPTPEPNADAPQYQLIDSRDNKYYWVAKFSDGNCWMTQNLDYDINSSSNEIALMNGGTATWNNSSATAPLATSTSIPRPSSSTSAVTSYNPGDYYLPDGNGEPITSQSLSSDSTLGDTNLHYHIGNFYRYNAAVGGFYASLSREFETEAKQSICPKGWAIPHSNRGATMVKAYQTGNPLYLTKGGQIVKYNSSSMRHNNQRSGGAYWTRTILGSVILGSVTTIDAYIFSTNSPTDSAYTGSIDDLYSIRCYAINNTHLVLGYDANGGQGAPESVMIETPESGTTERTISTATPTRENYIFLGWSTNKSATSATYQPGSTLEQDSDNPNITLYAVWGKNLSLISTMQEMTSNICANTPTPLASDGANTPQYKLTDTRDNKTYWVAKLADGHCWMTQNLDYDIIKGIAISPDKTDISYYWTPSIGTNEDLDSISSTEWEIYQHPHSFDFGDKYYYPSNEDGVDDIEYNSLAECVAGGHNSDDCEHYHVGNYYNWTAAVAENAAGSDYIEDGYNKNGSICPKGWTLPSRPSYNQTNIANGGHYMGLFAAYGLTTASRQGMSYRYSSFNMADSAPAPLYITKAGFARAASTPWLSYAGIGGGYWTKTVSGGDTSYGIVSNGYTDGMMDDRTVDRNTHQSIRCMVY